jgi:serine/threonine protein phosphatase 1
MAKDRILIIGDIHGCRRTLERLIRQVEPDPRQDLVIFVGDYIDRGKDPKGVVDLILSLPGYPQQVRCLMGNHEAMFLDALSGRNRSLHLFNGGRTTLKSYHIREAEPARIPLDHLRFYQSLQHMIELEDAFVVHAGFRPGIPVDQQALEDLVWIREPFIYSTYDFGKTVIFGHTVFPSPFIGKNKIGIDTGAVYGNRLTCLQWPSVTFHAVEACD